MEHKVENLVVSTCRNVWGYYSACAFVDNYLVSVRYDYKPTKKQSKADVISAYEMNR